MAMSDSPASRVRIWDLPTRIFHGCLALAAIGLLVTGKVGGEAMVWHARLGYCVAALLLFRLIWGFVGGHWSRFGNFPPAPRAAWDDLRRSTRPARSGHSPLGALSVYAMLIFLAAQVATGLFSETKEDFAGPLTALVSNATVHRMTGYHKNIGQWMLIGLVLLHLAAVGYYEARGQKLVGPMLHGDRDDSPGPPSRDDAGRRLLALAVVALCAGAVWAIVQLGS
jgi:cytochrome b